MVAFGFIILVKIAKALHIQPNFPYFMMGEVLHTRLKMYDLVWFQNPNFMSVLQVGRFRFCGKIWLVSSDKCSLKAAVPETYHFKQTSFDYIKLHAYFVAKMSKITITRIFCRENYNYAHILSRKRRKLQLRALVGRFSLQNTTVGRLEDYRTGSSPVEF